MKYTIKDPNGRVVCQDAAFMDAARELAVVAHLDIGSAMHAMKRVLEFNSGYRGTPPIWVPSIIQAGFAIIPSDESV